MWLSGVFIECGNSLHSVEHIHSVTSGSPSYHQLKKVASSGKSSFSNTQWACGSAVTALQGLTPMTHNSVIFAIIFFMFLVLFLMKERVVNE